MVQSIQAQRTGVCLPAGKSSPIVPFASGRKFSAEIAGLTESGWKLLDSDKVEVEESGIYEPMFGDFAPGMFFFTVVEPNIGKEEKVGYSVKEETYYLSIDGKIIAKIPLDANKK